MRDVLQTEKLDHLVRVLAEPRVGLREKPAAQRAFEFLRGGDQVVAYRQLDEHLQRLERASDAAPRQLERRHAGNVLAAEFDVTRRRLDLSENTVEKRRLPRAVRTYDADDLAGADLETHPVDRFDRTVRFAHVLHFEERRHLATSLDLKRSPIERMPPGNQIISATTATPNTARYHVCMNLSHDTFVERRSSGSRMMMTVPITGPKKRPEPPTMTASSIVSDVEKWNGPGSMNSTSDA